MMKSWDIFDTLIARKSVSPRSVFAIVEQVSKIKNFMAIRIAAEQNLVRQGLNYNIEDIYKEFQRITNAPENLCDSLKNLEVKVELDQCIPITENLRQVKAGDILISDMYLPEKVIRKMLDKAGLFAPVEIIITSGGKSSGRIWKEFADQGQFLFHIGDNVEVDVQKPRQYGFDSALTTLSYPNDFEQWLMQRDFQFGAYLREIRLRNPFTEEIKRTYWTLFTINVGMLIILVQLIDALQKKYGFEYLGFCGRDTYYLWLLYKKYKEDLGEEPPSNDYLYYSRKMLYYSRQSTTKYFRLKTAGKKSLMIDLIGTGTNLHYLRKKNDLDYSILICCHDMGKDYSDATDLPKKWVALSDSSDTDDTFSFINYKYTEFPLNDSLESFNRATHNSPIRINELLVAGKNISEIILSESNDVENFDVFEYCLREVLNSKIVWSRLKGDDTIENLKHMLLLFINLASKIVMKSRHVINEEMDRQDFIPNIIKSFESNTDYSGKPVKGGGQNKR